MVEPLHEALAHVLMDERVIGDFVHPLVELGLGGQVAVNEQVGHLKVGGLFGQLLDGIAAVPEDAVFVDVSEGLVGADEKNLKKLIVKDHDGDKRGTDRQELQKEKSDQVNEEQAHQNLSVPWMIVASAGYNFGGVWRMTPRNFKCWEFVYEPGTDEGNIKLTSAAPADAKPE